MSYTPGSSPHARGTRRRHPAPRLHPRFIPACAGNARRRRCPSRPISVHPRMRGEREPPKYTLETHDGSSPHARGTLDKPDQFIRAHRFIPACAGNARPDRMAMLTMTVHPRMRGERSTVGSAGFSPGGSSPHARGTRFAACAGRKLNRFIPACAGNATNGTGLPSSQTVHPRMRGERSIGLSSASHLVGSSPHARGTLGGLGRRRIGRRFIPACAGNARWYA